MKTAATKINFTKAAIEALAPPAPPAERRYVYDLKTPGLALSIFASGTKVFYLYRKAPDENGKLKPERIKIGPWPLITVEQARDKAAEHSGQIVVGENPNEKRRAKRNAPTLREVFDLFIVAPTRTKKKRNKSPKTVKEYRQQFEGYLRDWHDRPLSTINRNDVEKRHNDLSTASGFYTANRVLGLLKAVFNYAIDCGMYPVNPAARLSGFEEQSRDRFLLDDEMPKFWAALEAEPSEKVRDFILLALFTGQRRTNTASMRWADVSLERATWTIEQTKTGKHVVPLSSEAIAILSRRREAAGDCEYVFPAHHGGGYLKDPMRAWRDILNRAGIKDLRIHDLRRTMGSWQTKTGSSRAIVGKLLGHRREQTTAIYGRLDMQPVRDSVAVATAAMMAAAKPKLIKAQRKDSNGKAKGR